MNSVRVQDRIWLFVILALAVILRSINLESDLWVDEVQTLQSYVRLPFPDVLTHYTALNNHIFFSAQAKLSIAVFGESAWALRLPAVVAGVASVAALWWLARQIGPIWQAHLTALLLTVSYHHVWFSQNARGYTGLMLWGLLATGYFLRGLDRPTLRTWLLYGVVAAAAMYTHLSAGFFLVTHGFLWLVFLVIPAGAGDVDATRRRWMPLLGFGFTAGLTLALYAVLLPQMVETFYQAGLGATVRTEWREPLWAVLEVMRSIQGILTPPAALLLPVVLVFIAVGMVNLWRRNWPLVLMPMLHIPLTLLLLWLFSFNIWPRFFLVDLPFFLLFLVRGVSVIVEGVVAKIGGDKVSPAFPRRSAVAACLLGAAVSLATVPANYLRPKQDFTGAFERVEQARQPGDAVAVLGSAEYVYKFYRADRWVGVSAAADLRELQAGATRTWVVYVFPSMIAQAYPELWRHIEAEFPLVDKVPGTLGGGAVFIHRNR